MSYKSKYTGLQIDDILDSVESKQGKIEDLESIRAGAQKGATALQSYTEKYTGTVTGIKINGETKSGSGVIDLGTIESKTLTESDIAAMGFTKNTGTYSKPSTGIPKTDLASAVQTSLSKADTALQSYTEQYKGTVTGVKINGTTKNPSSGVVDLGTVITSHQDISGKQDKLVSGTNIKTFNGESILGSGDITISGGGDYLPSTGGTIDGDLIVMGTIASPTLIMANGGIQGYLRSNDYILGLTGASGDIVWGAEGSDEYYITAKGDGTKFLSDDGTYKTISGGNSDANVQAVDTGDVIDDVNVDYTTKTYVDGLVGDINSTIGDINSILESIINGGVSLITFTIDGTEYQAEEGMTWEQWVNSEYNISGMYLFSDRYVSNSDGLLIAAQGVPVSSTDPIVAGYVYHFMYSSDSGGSD